MIIENHGLNGIQAELVELDVAAEQLGFVRWQWEYYRATYDYKFEDKANQADYFLRLNTRTVEGKLEDPDAVLVIEEIYLGKGTFPHGLDYVSPLPENIVKDAKKKLEMLKQKLIS